jgi:primosomal protein N' (replication factor Y) (superfamily II helicase)
MHFLEVAVADSSYHGHEPLTYQYDQPLEPGNIVRVPLRGKEVVGVVTARVTKPSFALKSVVGRIQLPPLPPELIKLLLWMKAYYASPIGITTQQFLPKHLVDHVAGATPTAPNTGALPPLTSDQESALNHITDPGMYLLHGETGSGKTRVYIELAYKSLVEGKSAIILTPEIGLTSQLARDFQKVFQERVVIIHSQLKETTRQQTWVNLLAQEEPVVLIGPRSALFSPLRKVGLVVVDESHETAYKQDQTPYYHATRVASKLAELHKATIILGSATPLVGDYYLAQQKHRPIIRMTQTAASSNVASRKTTVIDLRDRTQFTRKPYLSDALIEETAQTLARHEQVLLFLNRRGTARVVICDHCDWQALCPHCDLALVYHGDAHNVRCHSCSYRARLPNSCPQCHNPNIILKSIGTKAITDDISSLFPEAKVMRFDTDNKKSERIELHYDDVRQGNVDIIVGTQTLAKGLDLPNLGLVGVIIADTSLYFPDFSAQERTYQLLSQVLGRVGRGHRESQAIIQTYAPDNPILHAVIHNKWGDFYDKELKERLEFLFPPFCYLLKLTCRRASTKAAQTAAEQFAKTLSEQGFRIAIEGPAPCFHEKISNKYQWQVIIKSKNRGELLKTIGFLPSGWTYDIDPMNLL